MDSVRQNKIARLIQKELAIIFQAESKNLFPGRMITVTDGQGNSRSGAGKGLSECFPTTTRMRISWDRSNRIPNISGPSWGRTSGTR